MAKEPEKIKLKDIKDEALYDVNLTRTVEYKGIHFYPDGKPKMRGAFIKLIQSEPKNEGAVDDYAEVTG